jgi:hypothetical protein
LSAIRCRSYHPLSTSASQSSLIDLRRPIVRTSMKAVRDSLYCLTK